MQVFVAITSFAPLALAAIPFRHAALHSSALHARQMSTTPSLSTFATATTSLITSQTATDQSNPTSSTTRLIGLNIVNQSPLGGWKTPEDWDKAFANIVNLPDNNVYHQTGPKFNAVRLYSTTEGSATDNTTQHLNNAILAARKHNLQIHAGLWSGGDTHTDRFAVELAGLDAVLAAHGCDNIVAVSVGSEDLYRNESTQVTGIPREPLQDIELLVGQVQQAMDVLDAHGCCDVKVTHTDTFGEWLKIDIVEPLVRQVDFLTVNIFPYWEGVPVGNANATFWQQLNDVRDLAAKYGKDVWIGETGWPVAGDNRGAAEVGASQLQQYWSDIGCALFDRQDSNAFWYVLWDGESASPSFGLLNTAGQPVIDIICP